MGTEPAAPPWAENMPASERLHFFDNFENGLPAWEPMAGEWDVTTSGDSTQYWASRREYALSYAGNPNWSDYRVSAQVTIDDDRRGEVGVVGRGDSDHYYFELVLGRKAQGKSWSIRQRRAHRWTTLATGPFDYQLGTPYVVRLSFRGQKLEGSISRNLGGSFDVVGSVEAPPGSWQVGRAGVVTYGGTARFDDLGVSSEGPTIALVDTANGWGPVSLLRDNTSTFPTGKPSGGWYVTPIHAILRPDGKVLISGFSRKGASNCTNGSGGTQRENGMTWLLDPTVLDSNPDNATLLTTPINEQNLDPDHDVLYCAGHSPLADGRIFLNAGTRYPSGLPDSSPERGLRYSRIFDGSAIVRVASNGGTYHYTQGGQNVSYPDTGFGDGGTVRGEKWYPTTLLMPDGKVLIFGGFHYSGGGPSGSDKANNSFEMFDTGAWDANHNTNPYSVLTQHATSGLRGSLPPTRGYSNMVLLPRPVPAGSAGGFARSVLIYGGRGRVELFNHEPGSFVVDSDERLFAGPNALTISPDGTPGNERAEGGSGVLLSDGRIMIFNGGHTGDGAKRAYVYNPYNDTWQGPTGAPCTSPSCSLDTTVSRMYGQAVQLPDGQVMIINGYGAQSGEGQDFEEDGNEGDIAGAVGDPRRPVLVDPYANPMTASPQEIWPEATHRGYHSVSLLLKDGRILTGGGKDRTHFTGCEKNELRIYTPPALRGNPTRPAITNIGEGQTIQVGSGDFTINYTGTLKSTRGVALVSMGALTHAFDMGQRYVPLTVVSGGGGGGSVVVKAPTSVNIAQPGYYNLFVINSAGVPSMGVSVKLTPPPACVYAVNGDASSYIEAELSSRKDGPFVTTADASRSNGNYVDITNGSGNFTTVPDEGKVMWYDVQITNGGDFYVWALVNAPDTSGDTAYISVNGDPDATLTATGTAGTWNWVRLSAMASPINAGRNTLKVKVREDGLKIDKLVLTRSSSFAPAGIGNTAQACNGPGIPSAPTATPGNGQVGLSWGAVTGATSYTVRWGTTSGNYPNTQPGITGTSTTINGLTNGTPHFFVVSAHTATQASGLSNETSATPGSAPTWTDADVGAVGIPGGPSTISGGTFTVKGAGADISGTADAFHFLYQTVTGNGSITARITSITGGDAGNTAKVGVMMRDPGADGMGANDVNAFTMIKPGAAQNKFQRRLTSGGTTVSSTATGTATPTWVRLTRTGNTLLGEQSPDGTSWTAIGSDTVTMTTVRVGLAVTSHTTTALTTAVFDNVTVNFGATNAPPTVATAAAASPSPAPGTTTALSVLGADDAGEAALTYTWSATGSPPAPVTFSANGTNAAKNTTATFTKAGVYAFQVVIQDAGGLTVISPVSMTVSQTFTSILVAPSSASVSPGGTQAFTATARDQFATALSTQPGFGWMVSGGGTISAGGLFTAGATPGGPFTVTATSGAVSGTAQVTVAAGPSAPTNLTVTSTGASQVNLAWTDTSSNETGFRVERKVNAGSFQTLTSVGVGVQTATDTTVAAGNTYTYRVIATGSADSPPSNEAVSVLRGMEADAFVRAGVNATLNYGASTALEAKLNATVDNNREFFVRFDLTDVKATVSSAKIRLFGNANTTAKVISVAGVSNVTWVEGTGTGQDVTGIDYNSRPVIDGAITTLSVGITAGFWEFDITSYVQAQKTAGASKISLSFTQTTSSTNGQTSFSSRQNATTANRPLVIISSK
jgi:hypothetical protein